MKKIFSVFLVFLIACGPGEDSTSITAQETTSTTSVRKKRLDSCYEWRDRTRPNFVQINSLLNTFYTSIGSGELSSSWIENQKASIRIYSVYEKQLNLNMIYEEVISEKVKNDINTAIYLYYEAFSKWEQGILQNNLSLFNEGSKSAQVADQLLEEYIVPYTELGTTMYSFTEENIENCVSN